MLESQERNRLVRGSRAAKEIHEYPMPAGVLIRQRAYYAARVEDRLHLVEFPAFGEQLLPGSLTKATKELVEIRIVQRPGHRIGLETQKPEHVAGHLPIAKMARHNKSRPSRQQHIDNLRSIRQLDELRPVVQVQLPRQM